MNFTKMITSTGSAVHYSAGGTRSLCGREMYRETRGAEGNGRICKRCEKSAPAHTEFRERIGFDAPVAESTPVEPVPTDVKVTTKTGERITYAYIPNGNPERVELFIQEAQRSRAFTDIKAEPTVIPAPVDHRRCEHRKSLSIDHARECPVYTDGMLNESCTCHYSDAMCEAAEPNFREDYDTYARWAVGPVMTREQYAAKGEMIKTQQAAGTLSANPYEWGKDMDAIKAGLHTVAPVENAISDAMMERDPEDAPYGPVDASLADRETQERVLSMMANINRREGIMCPSCLTNPAGLFGATCSECCNTPVSGYDFPVTVTHKADNA